MAYGGSRIDWTKCIICGDGGELKCPAKSLQGNAHEVYQTFLNLVTEFSSLRELPTSVEFNIQELEAKDLLENVAKWHMTCHLKFLLVTARSKLDRAKRR